MSLGGLAALALDVSRLHQESTPQEGGKETAASELAAAWRLGRNGPG